MKTCYIFGAAEGKPDSFKRNKDDLIIAADGGYKTVMSYNITPDIILGDFDSLGYVPEFSGKIIKHPVKKDDTDTLLAVKTGLELGFKRFIIYGGTGKRLDHTLANISTLAFVSSKGGSAYLCGDGFVITVIKDGEINFKSTATGNLSVFSCGDKSVGVCEKGLLYELSDAEISFDFPLGVSNEFIGKDATISVKKGSVAVYWSGSVDDLKENF